MTLTAEEFQALALALRDSGAVKVRAGELEVVWMPGRAEVPQTPFAERTRRDPKQKPPKNAEEARLRAYKAELEGTDP